MESVVFKNLGEMDLRAVTMFGVSAKVNDNPIGFFGTGLKYAISILIRNHVSFELYVGKDKYDFKKKTMDMRGKEFDAITMNGADLPFTTEVGKNWELWQAFRELYCNALDEGGDVVLEEDAGPEVGTTRIVIHDKRIVEIYFDRYSIVLNRNKNLLFKSAKIEIYNNPSKAGYYRGVRVFDFALPSKYTYNMIEQTDLTEDRGVKNQDYYMRKIAQHTASMDDRDAIHNVLASSADFMESIFSYSLLEYFDDNISEAFEAESEALFNQNNNQFNLSAKSIYMKRADKKVSRNRQAHEMTVIQSKQLSKALEIVQKVYPEATRYKTIVVKDLGQNVMAQADTTLQAMIVSSRVFELGSRYLVSTLIEEYFHLWTGFGDQSRALQTYLFDQITTLIEQYVVQEPI